MNLTIGNGARSVSFDMHLDPAHPQDHAVLHYYEQGIPPEPEVVHFMFQAVKEGDVCIDAGANIGFFTLLLSKLVGDKGAVCAFEPSSQNCIKLNQNVGSISNIGVNPVALWRDVALVQIHCYADGGFDGLRATETQAAGTECVRAITLDSLASASPSFMKMDIEGAEMDAMLGGQNLLNKYLRYVVSELNEKALARFGHTTQAYIDFFHQHGFDLFVLNPAGGLPALVPRGSKVVPTRENCNVLFSKPEWVAQAYPEIKI